MNIAAYCRVSTEREDQLNSLEAQKKFFLEYTDRHGDNLVRLYADEGISGTKIKNRKQFLKMMQDAEYGLFDMVVVKDISRFARNTVDLLQNIRRLRELGIETQFLTANMTSMGNSEFVLTVFGALAQEESANTSKRVKFGKRINAEKGRVPNLVYGYDKTIGDYFNLTINNDEAKIVRQIFDWYINDGYGATKISIMLNERGIRTKRDCKWTSNAICRILENELYTGKIVNGKSEVADFLTGRRAIKSQEEWFIKERPELRIIDDETFETANKIKKNRNLMFKTQNKKHSNQHLFSTLIRCKECGWSFRRTVRTYKNTYVKWVCSGRNGKGADSCPNAGIPEEVDKIFSREVLYAKTGIQRVNYNTIYQLYCDKKSGKLEKAEHMLLMPEYLSYKLTGIMKSEYTISSTTSLLNAETLNWDYEIINALGIKNTIFKEILKPGNVVGRLSENVKKYVGFDTTVIFAPAHDTASAVAACELKGHGMYISSGTWSLIGAHNDYPVLNPAAMNANFTNEGGVNNTYRFLKNIMGMCLFQNIRKNLQKKYTYDVYGNEK